MFRTPRLAAALSVLATAALLLGAAAGAFTPLSAGDALTLSAAAGASTTTGAADAEWTCPAPGTVLFPGLTGSELLDSLRVAYRPPVGLDYAAARNVMYGSIDNHDGLVTGIYTGFTVAVDPEAADPKSVAFAAGINTEHTWPKSKGAEGLPREADMHHLFPTRIQPNADRGNNPFAEIPDVDTDAWYRLDTIVATPLPQFIDQYSERDLTYPGTVYDGRWEPPEAMKGNIARAMFYFYTVYRSEADAEDSGFFGVQKDDLRAWNKLDPADTEEYERTCAIAPYQDDRPNPFVIDSTLVDRAYFNEVPVVLAAFTAEAAGDGVRLSWRTENETDHAGFHVFRDGNGGETRLTEALVVDGPVYGFVDRSGRPGARYDYWIEAVARDGSRERFGPRSAVFPRIAPVVSVRPNPLRAGETARIDLSGAFADGVAPVSADLFDLAGRRVRSWRGAGELARGWDGRLANGVPAAPGVYFMRVVAGAERRSVRVVLIR